MIWTIIGVAVFCYGLLHTAILFFIDCDLRLFFAEKLGKSVGRLKGKVIYITGASSGIGEHTAVALAKRGVKLVLAARRQDELERVKQNCINASNGELSDRDVLTLPMNVTNFSAHEQYFQTALDHFGGVDVLLNNAGRSQRAVFDNVDLSVDRDMFDLNVFATINLSRVALRHFNRKGHGHIAVTSSVAGFIGAPNSATYNGTKHALHGYFNTLRAEKIGKNIPVTILCPGPTYTNFLQECFTEKDGQKYGVTAQATDKRLSGERCGELCAIAIANQLRESWMGVFPAMPFCYLVVYFPLVYNILLSTFGPEKIFKMRDGPNTHPQLTEGKKLG